VLAAYLAAAIALPVLHRRHHALHGADHVHGALGTTYFANVEGAAFHHAAFDADLAALELADVAHAGTAAVDCALAEYTLVVCDDPASAHAHNFGDQLLAHSHQPTPPPPPIDPSHGAGALEHLGASLLGAAPFVLPPPARPAARIPVEKSAPAFASAPRFTHAPRGPPLG
jgi:hypothetical protein